MPIHDQSYRHYGGQREPLGRAWLVIVGDGVRTIIAQARLHRPAAVRLGCRSSSAPSRCTWRPTSRRCRCWPRKRDTYREFLEKQGIFVFFITIWVGAGLIANDRRANALQIYLSKPLGARRVHRRQAWHPDGLPDPRHLGAGDAAPAAADALRRAASTSSARTSSSSRPSRSSRSCRCWPPRSPCWRSRRSRRAAGSSPSSTRASCSSPRRSTAIVCGVTRSTVVVVDLVPGEPRADRTRGLQVEAALRHAVGRVPVLAILVLIGVSIVVLERRVRGVEVVK